MENILNTLLTDVNDIMWTYVLVIALIACGVWFTVKTRFMQFRMIPEMIRLLTDSAVETGQDTMKGDASGKGKERHISSFQAFAVSLASRVGTGNLAGVATAIAIGGPGAVFWMWLIALIGAATSFVESTLAQLYKLRNKDSFIGGPAYYIQRGLKKTWMAQLFAVLITLQFGLSNNSIQSNTICGAMNVAFGFDTTVTGIVLVILSLLVVFGGIQRIAKVSSVIVPLMAVGYFLLAVYIVITNVRLVPEMFSIILKDAFGITQVTGGGIGAVMMNGIKRGLFSNEAGEGSAPNAAATARTSHPVKQGLIQALGVFTDTIIVCSCTAFIILLSGTYRDTSLNGIALTQSALWHEIGDLGVGLYSCRNLPLCLLQHHRQLLLWRGKHPFPHEKQCRHDRLSHNLCRCDGHVRCAGEPRPCLDDRRFLYGTPHDVQSRCHRFVGQIRFPPAEKLP